jgi:glutamate--cysteine ligase
MNHELESVAECCPECRGAVECLLPYVTSLRVSRFGYSNRAQRAYTVSFNSLHEHIRDIRKMVSAINPDFARLGLYQDGRQVQLNTNVLQKESEFYSSIRFKQNVRAGETQLAALEKRGVGYLEVRILDLNPLDRLGISLQQLHLLQIFMLFCLFEPSPVLLPGDFERTNKNHHRVALMGRKPGLQLDRDGRPILMGEWGTDLLMRMKHIAVLIDGAVGGERYRSVIDRAVETLWDSARTPSALIQQAMAEEHESHIEYGLRIAAQNRNHSDSEFEEDNRNEPSERELPVGAFHAIIDRGGNPAWSCCRGFGCGRQLYSSRDKQQGGICQAGYSNIARHLYCAINHGK